MDISDGITAECMLGQVNDPNTKQRLPIFMVDYGSGCPSFWDTMNRYRKVVLDISSSDQGKTVYHIVVDRVVVSPDASMITEALMQDSVEGMLRSLAQHGELEFSVIFNPCAESHRLFTDALELSAGTWQFVVLAEDATVLFIDYTHTVINKRKDLRSNFECL